MPTSSLGWPRLWLAAGMALGAAFCVAPPADSAAPPVGEVTVATIGEGEITVADVEREMARRGGNRPGSFTTPESRRGLLDELVRHRILVEAARSAGYERDEEIVRALELLMAAKLERERLEPLLAELTVSDEEIAARYRTEPEFYSTPEQVRVALIRIDVGAHASEEKRAEVEAATAEILAEAPAIEAAQGFGDLARRFSADGASRYVGGVVGWLVRGDRYRWPDAAVDAAFARTSVGDVGLVDTEDARYLVRLIERRPAAQRPLEAVSDGIRRELLRQKRAAARAAFYDRLRRQFSVEIDAAAFDLVAPPASKTPPTVPGH